MENLIKEKLLMGYSSIEEALTSAKINSQSEVLMRMLTGRNIFLSGKAGTGKTTVIKTFVEIIDLLYKGRIRTEVTATTGVAAILINGKTLHSALGMMIDNEEFVPSEKSFRMGGYSISKIRKMDILIVDEISMLSADTLVKVDKMLRYAKGKDKLFGGMQVIFSGDFLQLPPIIKGKQYTGKTFAFEVDIWEQANFDYCYLEKLYRTEDILLKEVLDGILEQDILKVEKIIQSRLTTEFPKGLATLFTKNRDVDTYNLQMQEENPNDLFEFDMEVFFGTTEDVEDLVKHSRIEKTLKLKIGDIVMVTSNNDSTLNNYYNGLIGTVKDISYENVLIETHDKREYLISPKVFEKVERKWVEVKNGDNKELVLEENRKASISQFPLKLSYALTIHKSQGQTFDGVVCDLTNCFTDGLGYVALSRARDLNSIYIKGIDDSAYKINAQCKAFMEKAKYINTAFDPLDFYHHFMERVELRGIPLGKGKRKKENQYLKETDIQLPTSLAFLERDIIEYANVNRLSEVENLPQLVYLLEKAMRKSN